MARSAQPFLDLLKEEQGLVEKFIAVLQQEQQILVEGAKADLDPVTSEKNRLAGFLAQLDVRRNDFLRTQGISNAREDIERWLLDQDAAATDIWNRFLDSARKAQQLNDLNGKLVAERMSNNQQAIHTLMAATNRPATYGPDGQTTSLGRGRTLGSA